MGADGMMRQRLAIMWQIFYYRGLTMAVFAIWSTCVSI